MPRLWVDYLAFIVKLGSGTKARRTFDRALQALPITQHDKVGTRVYLAILSDGVGLFQACF